ncbi:beta-glucosidase [Chitinophaga costaii]|uniref:Beta-glucosidase n=1 Tax=Chitinophaga costaii TaxID=1335309 RepID=A0A1C4FNR8_9BACT|nr:hypothetical protein [Chitinophaga costaii]PUZ29924.1 hypothetical protein DCM91_00105 [Chitinophaga costaii]SCC57293.1 beta-glucosidase [Chitinophaga costaii]
MATATAKGYDKPENSDTMALKNAAANARVIVLGLGENAYAESPGNISDLVLAPNQVALTIAAPCNTSSFAKAFLPMQWQGK